MEDYDLEQHLQRLCNAVGGYDVATNLYVMGVECVECLRDIKKLLRLDDKTPERFLLRKLGEWQFVKQDLLAIVGISSERRITEAILELLVPLTWPLSSEVALQCAVEQLDYQVQYKQLLINQLEVFILKLVELLGIEDRKQSDQSLVKMILTLVRNLTLIRDAKDSLKDQQVHDNLLDKLKEVHFPEILITMTSTIEKENDLQILDLLWTMLCSRRYSVEQLLSEDVIRPVYVSQQQKKPLSSRPPTFRGSFVVMQNNTKHLVNNPDAAQALGNAMDKGKKSNRSTKKKSQTKAVQTKVECSMIESKFIIDLMTDFLRGPFNLVSEVIKKNMIREREDYTQEVILQYVSLTSFVLQYVSSAITVKEDSLKFSSVADVLNVPFLMLCIKYIVQYQDAKQWSLVAAFLDMFFELLSTIDLMTQSNDHTEAEVADSVLCNLFTRIDHLKEITKCLTMPSKDIAVMISALKSNHQLLKVIERYNKDNDLIVVKKIRRKLNDENEDSIAKKPSIKELPFDFAQFEKEYCTEQVVNVCIALLKYDLKQTKKSPEDKTVRYVAAMLHRIAVNAKLMPLLYKLDIIVVFEAIMKDRNELMRRCTYYKDMLGLIRYVTSGFFAKLKDYPLLFVEVLFPKHKQDVHRIIDGLTDNPSDPVPVKKRILKDVDVIAGDAGYFSEPDEALAGFDTEVKAPSSDHSQIKFEVIEASDDEELAVTQFSPMIVNHKSRVIISDDEE